MYGKTSDKMISIVTLTILVAATLSNIDEVSGLPNTTTKEKQAIGLHDSNFNITPPSNSHILKLMGSKSNKTKRAEQGEQDGEDKLDKGITATLCRDHLTNKGKPYVRDPNSCTRYYKCMQRASKEERYVTIWLECDDGYVYSEDAGNCAKPDTAPKCVVDKKKEKNSAISIIPSLPLSSHPYSSIVASWVVIIFATLLFA